jgi:hypothetical protein
VNDEHRRVLLLRVRLAQLFERHVLPPRRGRLGEVRDRDERGADQRETGNGRQHTTPAKTGATKLLEFHESAPHSLPLDSVPTFCARLHTFRKSGDPGTGMTPGVGATIRE